MPEDFAMSCVECLLHHPYKHAEPWTCPACGLIHAVVMPGVPIAKGPEKRPKWMTPEREEAIEQCLRRADYWQVPRSFGTKADANVHVGGLGSVAFRHVQKPGAFADLWLEAAALLRDGWNPGDKVVRK